MLSLSDNLKPWEVIERRPRPGRRRRPGDGFLQSDLAGAAPGNWDGRWRSSPAIVRRRPW
ncbi:hypothetical protein P4114_20060 [Pseudomonas aeruginosa]|nr:hypothetical protein [Pseudomonas aeruginosa]